MPRKRLHRRRPLSRRCAGSAFGEQLILICLAALVVGLVASVILRYGTGAWLPLALGLAAWAVLMAGVIYWNERRNRLARLRGEERLRAAGKKPAAGNRHQRKGSDAWRG